MQYFGFLPEYIYTTNARVFVPSGTPIEFPLIWNMNCIGVQRQIIEKSGVSHSFLLFKICVTNGYLSGIDVRFLFAFNLLFCMIQLILFLPTTALFQIFKRKGRVENLKNSEALGTKANFDEVSHLEIRIVSQFLNG